MTLVISSSLYFIFFAVGIFALSLLLSFVISKLLKANKDTQESILVITTTIIGAIVSTIFFIR